MLPSQDMERWRIYLKLSEELSELSTELLQSVNKPKKDNLSDILSEIKDVEKWIAKLKESLENNDGE